VERSDTHQSALTMMGIASLHAILRVLQMRLDKFLSNNTAYSRAQVHRFIRAGDVSVNGEHKVKADQKISDTDKIYLHHQLITARSSCYLMLHKPTGYVCANHDSENPTVIDLLDNIRTSDLQIVGRLDKDTTGLVLITDDGQWNHQVTAPISNCKKTYLVTLADPIYQETADRFTQGILLDGEKKLTAPAQLELIDSNHARLTISEGKYHQVKRMFAAVGNKVTGLHREKIGNLILDPKLQPGDYRSLTEQEIQGIFND
jgi:16S rRNA pseudouridine516 synthase